MVQADSQNNAIRRLVVATSTVSTLAGTVGTSGFADGFGSSATFKGPLGVTVDALGTIAIVADSGNNQIRLITISSGVVGTLAGRAGVTGTSDGVGTTATFRGLYGVSVDAAGSFALIVSQTWAFAPQPRQHQSACVYSNALLIIRMIVG